ncbi:phosphoglycerol geranylgeranyltransferase [Sediminibacterium sp.]|uniref:phosphoglycerol geranylgeranyltransferase n=1 Tax=Sediminibacterium sp. TaxID=1917865 RepID=UPI0027204221|nr:phosphoglycerol geranylgeranyltransferase [Sediminibacterium sp.]MDO9000323.1 phosphoglycerol geranylgeranyltransferase [Bacteroidota bacterium]MDP3147108.1 phosphoglycerol geranylgeranyltransferase [Bacteroidota bacterium]MDP3567363.1 phosphoglycerol geranylgeranyltransferase [Sediminibacterium sp.]
MKFKELIKKLNTSKKPLLAVLIDPDKFNSELIHIANKSKASCFLVGGSELKNGDVTKTILAIKKISKIPVILFPGNESQLSKSADGLLLLSLLSGRNPDYLIGKHITAAPIIKKLKLDYLSTAYILIDGGVLSATQKVTKTLPLNPNNKELIINTALAAEQLGFKAIYLEAGSGAKQNIAAPLIKKIKKEITLPLIVGGGIDSVKKVQLIINSGANMIVIGNALEKNVFLLNEISKCF